MSGPRNHWGVNDSCDLYRTVDGVRYVWSPFPPTAERMKLIRAAGLRARRFVVDGESQIFAHPEDEPAIDLLLSTPQATDSGGEAGQ